LRLGNGPCPVWIAQPAYIFAPKAGKHGSSSNRL